MPPSKDMYIIALWHDIIWFRCKTVNFLENPHDRDHIVCPVGGDVLCLRAYKRLFMRWPATAMLNEITDYTGLHYIGTRLYVKSAANIVYKEQG